MLNDEEADQLVVAVQSMYDQLRARAKHGKNVRERLEAAFQLATLVRVLRFAVEHEEERSGISDFGIS
jgi:hypothetical protein